MYLKRNKHYLLSAALIAGAILSVPVTQASTNFLGSAALTFTINSITNLNLAHSSDLSGLEVLGYFDQGNDLTNYYVVNTGDGIVTANNPGIFPTAVTNSFSQIFSVSGSALNGTVDSRHTGLYNLAFTNTGSDTYAIGLTLGYQLNANAAGLNAVNNVALDYFTLNNGYSDYAAVGAFTLADRLSDTQSVSGFFTPINFIVNSNDIELVSADVLITGTLEASPVPVPAAVWFFVSGLLGVLGLNKRRTGLRLM